MSEIVEDYLLEDLEFSHNYEHLLHASTDTQHTTTAAAVHSNSDDNNNNNNNI